MGHTHGLNEQQWDAGEYYLQLWRDNHIARLEKEIHMDNGRVYIVLQTDYRGIEEVKFASLNEQRAKDVYERKMREHFAQEGLDMPSGMSLEDMITEYYEMLADYPSPERVVMAGIQLDWEETHG